MTTNMDTDGKVAKYLGSVVSATRSFYDMGKKRRLPGWDERHDGRAERLINDAIDRKGRLEMGEMSMKEYETLRSVVESEGFPVVVANVIGLGPVAKTNYPLDF